MTTLHVACAVEGDAYLAHCASMLHSLLAHHPEVDVRIHFMHGPDISAPQEGKLAEMVARNGGEISFLRVPDDRIAGLPTKGFTRKATWYRIFLPEMRPDVDRMIYLDSDLIVLDSLVPLFATDLEANCIGAVTNVFQWNHVDRPAQLGLAGPDVYFNAGVLLMDLDLMRREQLADALYEYGVANAEKIEWRDQDALNVVLGERRLPLHPRWNVMNSMRWDHAAEVFGAEAVAEARISPAIRHFEGPSDNKPWHYLCERDLHDLYMQHRRQTPWPRVRREGLTPRNVVRRARRRHRYSARGVH
jgi:lipopolysaccharide biosynthesis glycosyltransferase